MLTIDDLALALALTTDDRSLDYPALLIAVRASSGAASATLTTTDQLSGDVVSRPLLHVGGVYSALVANDESANAPNRRRAVMPAR